ncbi:hypothetical protein PR048_031429 [Dryococelus australis]|uniref:Uncharacterized protein n=1 Tax=Dryococelus australis TaxID=614101 RepID=A0ABQ9G7Z2_9NEOP|nr:hypothetical protein PR048_031429 [Dryococelus australis]
MASSCYVVPQKLSLGGSVAENWSRFKQSFEICLTATGLSKQDDHRKIAILLNVIGEDVLAVYDTSGFTKGKNTYENVLCKFEGYCAPKKNVLYERYLIYNRFP